MKSHVKLQRLGSIPRSFLLAASIVVLLISTENVYGLTYSSLSLQPRITVSSPPVSLQTGTAGSSTICANNTSAKVSVAAPAPTPTYCPNESSGQNWWKSDYSYRKKMTIVNNNAIDSIPAKFTMNFTIDTQQLITAGKLQADGDDLRVVWWNSSSSSWLELDRLNTTNFNTISTTVKFRTQTSISAGSSDYNYYIYYGYSGATNPLANGGNVYFFEDLFNRADSSTVGAGWIEYDGIVGTGTSNARILNNKLNLASANVAYDTQAYHMLSGLANRSAWEFEWDFSRTGAESIYSMWMQLGKYSSMSNTSNTAGAAVYLDWTGTGAARGPAATAHQMFRVWNGGSVTELGVLSGSHVIKVDMDLTAGSLTILVDGNNKGNYAVYQKLSSYDCLRFAFEQATIANFGSYDVGSTRTYLTVNTNPSVNINQEQYFFGSYVSGTVPASVQTVDPDYFVAGSAGSANSTTAYHPSASGYSLLGNTTLVSGNTTDLVSDNGAYMILRSYVSATTGQAVYAHQETTTIGGTNYYQMRTGSANQAGTALTVSMASVGRVNFGKFVYPLAGITSIPSSIWTLYYRSWRSTASSEVVTLRPDAVGTYTEWATVFPSGTPHWDAVNDATDDGDSTYIETATLGHRDSFSLPDIASHATVSSVTVYASAKRTGGSTSLQIGIRSGTTDSWSSGVSPTASYVLYSNTWNTDPNTGSAWTAAGVNALQASVRTNDNKNVRVTQVYVEVTATIPPVGHCDIDILTRKSDGAVRNTIATNVTNSVNLTTTAQTLSVTYIFAGYTVVNQTDYLEIDIYVDVTYAKTGTSAYLRIDDNTLVTDDQTRATNIMLPSEYTAEVEFTGTSNTEPWAQLAWTVDSSFSTTSVTATLRLFNNQTGQYPSSGDGYMTDTIGTTDVTKTQTVTINATRYRDGSGNWKIKVKGLKTTNTQFDFKIDWVEFKPTYYTQYTVSTEFLFSSMTKNTPTQLNFTVVSEYNIASVLVTIQVWNYSSSAYVTSGEGYLTYPSSGTNETKFRLITTNPQFYTSNGNAKIKITGVLSTTTQYQQRSNQVKLVYSYSSSSNYNYVLKIVNQVSDAWKIRLKAYSQSNIGRLNNCTIYFRNESDSDTSGQVYILNGIYTQQIGPWYDMPGSIGAERRIIVTLDASNPEASYVYVYLEILVPSKTTYAQYVITFEIT